jgi:hypothetical membrane protein
MLQLLATFDEVYGPLHVIVSILFFVSLGFASIVYAAEAKSILGLGSVCDRSRFMDVVLGEDVQLRSCCA